MEPALKIYEMDLPLRANPEESCHVTFYSPQKTAGLRGLIILFHDLADHAGRYRTLAKDVLIPAGFSLVIPDLPGFGLSAASAPTSTMGSCMDTIATCVDLLTRETRRVPLFAMGQGMGGNLLLNYLLELSAEDPDLPARIFHAAVVTSPFLARNSPYPDFWRSILEFWGRLFPSTKKKLRLDPETLTDDRYVLLDREQDRQIVSRIQLNLYTELLRSGARCTQEAATLALPLLLMYGEAESLVSRTAIRELAGRLPEYMNVIAWPQGRHELFAMQEREPVQRALLEYLGLCLKRGLRPIERVRVERPKPDSGPQAGSTAASPAASGAPASGNPASGAAN